MAPEVVLTLDEDLGLVSYPPYELIVKGGPGSGHHGHKGRPGKVGGSLPSGAGGGTEPQEYRVGITMDDLMGQNDFHWELSDIEWLIDNTDGDFGTKAKERARLEKQLEDAIMLAMIDFTEEIGYAPTNLTFTDDIDEIFNEYYDAENMTEEQRHRERKMLVYGLLGSNTKASFVGNEQWPDKRRFIHLNIDVDTDESGRLKFGGQGKVDLKNDPDDFHQTVIHELAHWLQLRATTVIKFPDVDEKIESIRTVRPSDEWLESPANRMYDPSHHTTEYQADLITSIVTGNMGKRNKYREPNEKERADQEKLYELIADRMSRLEEGDVMMADWLRNRAAYKPVIELLPWGDGTFEGVLVAGDEGDAGVVIYRGGPGSGHHGHRGRPGEVGGSLPGGAGSSFGRRDRSQQEIELLEQFEKTFRDRSLENAYVYDVTVSRGERRANLIDDVRGNDYMVDLSNVQGGLTGRSVIHNHPTGETVSSGDFRLLLSERMREIIAVGVKDGNPVRSGLILHDAEQLTNDLITEIDEERRSISEMVYEEQMEEYRSLHYSLQEVDYWNQENIYGRHNRNVWKKLVEVYPDWLTYFESGYDDTPPY